MKGCVESSTMSVLVNGSPTKEFIYERGLRQGDRLAPFLFLSLSIGITSCCNHYPQWPSPFFNVKIFFIRKRNHLDLFLIVFAYAIELFNYKLMEI